MLLLARVRRTILDRGLIPRGAGVVVGTSGGPDSTALLDVLGRLAAELDLRLVAVGVDHGLRDAAATELDLAAAHAARIRVPFERASVSVAPHGSVQAEARAARYAALRAVAESVGASHVAVGHTLDDQAETVVARILRGSGLRGLGGIDPARDDAVVRPLIDATRAEVLAYLAERSLPFVEDPSNRDARFERSRVRHEILPALVAEDAQAATHLAWLADEARAAHQALEALATVALADAMDGHGISVAVLRRSPEVVGLRALRRALGPDLGRAHLSVLSAWLQGQVDTAEVRLPGGRTARIASDRIIVTPLTRSGRDEEA